jgi:hypothetical protein
MSQKWQFEFNKKIVPRVEAINQLRLAECDIIRYPDKWDDNRSVKRMAYITPEFLRP